MNDVKTPLQTKIFQVLSPLIDLYDVAPVTAEYPYTEIGETIEIEDMDKDTFGQETTVTFYIRDRFQGSAGSRVNVNDIKNTILTELRKLPKNGLEQIDGFRVTAIRLDDSNSQKIADDTFLYFTEILRIMFRTYQLPPVQTFDETFDETFV